MLKTVGLYAMFAAASIVINIATQMACMVAYEGPYSIPLSVAAGTLTGLLAKYALDKRWIFAHVSRNHQHEVRTFFLYGLMGVLTTLLFWGTEYAFHRLFHSDGMRYLGGAIGLVGGYVVKYMLDFRFTFSNPSR